MTISPHISKLPQLSSNTREVTVKEYETLFMIAIQRAQIDDIKALLKLGVNPNCRVGIDGTTALHLAAGRGDMVIFDILYATENLNMDALSSRNTPALLTAVSSKQEAFIRKMIERGANIDLQDRFGMTALHHSVYMDALNITKMLLAYDCNRNPLDFFFNTPLVLAAVDVGSMPMVQALVEHGADVNFDIGSDTMPLLLAACLSCNSPTRLEIVRYLLRSGINPNVTDPKTYRNALHMVAINNNVDLAKLLLSYGTLSTHRDLYNLVPYNIAQNHKNDEVADLLEEAYVEHASSCVRLTTHNSVLALPTLIFLQEKGSDTTVN